MRRLPRRLLSVLSVAAISLAVLLVIAAAITHAVLSSAYPRQRAIAALHELTGLEVDALSVETGWAGTTTVRDVTFKLPLEDEPILTAERVRIVHPDLVRLALGWSFDPDEIEIVAPRLDVRRDGHGRWNLIAALDLVSAAADARDRECDESDEGKKDRDSAGAALPGLTIRDAVITVEHAGETGSWSHLEFRGARSKAGPAWTFRATLGLELTIEGKLLLGPVVSHDVRFEARRLGRLLGPWSSDLPPLGSARGKWVGKGGDAYESRIELSHLEIGGLAVSGELLCDRRERIWTVRPRPLRIESAPGESGSGGSGDRAGPSLCELVGGEVRLGGGVVVAERLRADTPFLQTLIDGEWQLDRRSAEITLEWSGELTGLVSLGGTSRFTLSLSEVGPGRLTGGTRFEIAQGQRSARGSMDFRVQGSSLRELTGLARFAELEVAGNRTRADLAGAALLARRKGDVVRLERLDLPGAGFAFLEGRIDLARGSWKLDFETDEWRIGAVGPPIDVDVTAEGTAERVDFSRFAVEGERLRFAARGVYLPGEATPLQARSEVSVPAGDGAEGSELTLEARLDVAGGLTPLDLRFTGDLDARSVPLLAGRVERIHGPWKGSIREDSFDFEVTSVRALGGAWHLEARYPYRERTLAVKAASQDASVDQIVKLSGLPVTADGHLELDLELLVPKLDASRMTMEGRWLVSGTEGSPYLEGAKGRLRADRSELGLEDIELKHEGGTIHGSARFNLADRRSLLVDLESARWPLGITGTELRIELTTDLQAEIDLADANVRGDVLLDALVSDGGRSVGAINVTGLLDGTELEMRLVQGSLFGGRIEGNARLPFRHRPRTRLDLEWHGVDLGQLAGATALNLEGKVSGYATIAPAKGSHPPDELAVRLRATTHGGSNRNMAIEQLSIEGVINQSGAVLEEARIDIAGGTIVGSGQTSYHADQRYGYLYTKIERPLSLERISSLRKDGEPLPGRIDGHLAVGGYFEAPHRLFGSGTVFLSKSDLAFVPVVSHIYRTVDLDFGASEPTGYGEAGVTFEGEGLRIPRFRYFNRGMELVGQLVIEDLTKGGESPVRGLVAATARPFRELELILLKDVDGVLSTLQSDSTTVRVTGRLAAPETRTVLFSAVQENIARMLKASLGP